MNALAVCFSILCLKFSVYGIQAHTRSALLLRPHAGDISVSPLLHSQRGAETCPQHRPYGDHYCQPDI